MDVANEIEGVKNQKIFKESCDTKTADQKLKVQIIEMCKEEDGVITAYINGEEEDLELMSDYEEGRFFQGRLHLLHHFMCH